MNEILLLEHVDTKLLDWALAERFV